jgi:hydrogenase nickel incorporation protein HypA/HybF
MHEYSLATALMEQVLAAAMQNRLASVETVEIEVGALQLVVPEALDLAFNALAEGTPAQGAKLVQEEAALKARCRACGAEYEPEIDRYTCPACGRAEAEIIQGRYIILRSISGPQNEQGGET